MTQNQPGKEISSGDRVEQAMARARAESALEVAGEAITVRIPRAIELLGIGRSKLYELIAEGEIDTIKVGSATLVVVTSLKASVLRQRGIVKTPAFGLRDLAKLYAEQCVTEGQTPRER